MATNSGIEWTDATWNPASGCTRVSPGCDNCYAVTMTHRLEAMGQAAKYGGLTVLNGRGERQFNGKVRTHDSAVMLPLKWRKPRQVFVNSMSDLFHRDVPFDFVDRVFAVMALCPQHTFQVLTKRPERMANYFRRGRQTQVQNAIDNSESWDNSPILEDEMAPLLKEWPLPNVWLGTSIENQPTADERIHHLLRCPAAVRFLSCEPLLGLIEFSDVSRRSDAVAQLGRPALSGIGWVIVGGESGPHARPMVLGWAKDIVRQCAAAKVPCFVKQVGSNPTNREGVSHPSKDKKGGDWSEWPEELRVRQFPMMEAAHA